MNRYHLCLAGLLTTAGTAVLTFAASPVQITPIFRITFQDPLPFSATWDQKGGGSADLFERTGHGPGACGPPGTGWGYERVAPAADNGGFASRGYIRQTFCSFEVSRISGTWTGGFSFGPPAALDNTWPTSVFYARMRLYFEGPITADSGGDTRRELKFWVWHRDVFGGDQRVIAFLERGANCGAKSSTHVCLTLARNIFTDEPSERASVPLPVAQWHHVQWAWRHGPRGESFVKVWSTSASVARPDASGETLRTVTRSPGGTDEWVRDEKGYNGQMDLGGVANNDTRFKEPFVIRYMDFEIDDEFDPAWAADRATTRN
jgi:hypothetical protein